MNRADFQSLTEIHLQEANALLDAGHFGGAYYLAGYAIECALKACICKQVDQYDFPRTRTFSNECFSHELGPLLRLAGLDPEKDPTFRANPNLRRFWQIVREWNEQSRYNRKDEVQAEGAPPRHQRPSRRSPAMDQEILVNSEIDDGKTILQVLSQQGFDVTAAAWLQAYEESQWDLFIASTVVDDRGGFEAYGYLNSIVDEIPGLGIDSMRVKLIGATSETARAIVELRDRYPARIATKIGSQWLGRFLVDRGYIYPPVTSATRATPPASPLPRAT